MYERGKSQASKLFMGASDLPALLLSHAPGHVRCQIHSIHLFAVLIAANWPRIEQSFGRDPFSICVFNFVIIGHRGTSENQDLYD